MQCRKILPLTDLMGLTKLPNEPLAAAQARAALARGHAQPTAGDAPPGLPPLPPALPSCRAALTRVECDTCRTAERVTVAWRGLHASLDARAPPGACGQPQKARPHTGRRAPRPPLPPPAGRSRAAVQPQVVLQPARLLPHHLIHLGAAPVDGERGRVAQPARGCGGQRLELRDRVAVLGVLRVVGGGVSEQGGGRVCVCGGGGRHG